MKNALLFLFVLVVSFGLFPSCMRQFSEVVENEQINNFPGKRIEWPKTKAGSPARDSLGIIAYRQSSPELRIMSYIHYAEGSYSLVLTSEEATLLGFSSQLYERYQAYVESLNAQ